MLLFVGLGNPTADSENNRHNVGFKIIDSINKKFSLQNKNQNLKAYWLQVILKIKKFTQLNLLLSWITQEFASESW